MSAVLQKGEGLKSTGVGNSIDRSAQVGGTAPVDFVSTFELNYKR